MLAAVLLVLGGIAACGGDDDDSVAGGSGDEVGEGSDSELVEDLTDGGEDAVDEEPCTDGTLPPLSVVNEATGQKFVTCNGSYQDGAGMSVQVQRLAYGSPELAAAEWEPFLEQPDAEPAEGDGWSGVYLERSSGMLLGSSGATFISVSVHRSADDPTAFRDLIETVFELLLAHDGPIRSI